MLFIAHRGNLKGPNPQNENEPDYLLSAITAGFNVEADAWLVDGQFFLGHDAPKYKTDRNFFRNKKIWTHCKNASAFIQLSRLPDVNCFMHDKDEIALTTRGYLWSNTYCKVGDDRTVLVNLNSAWHSNINMDLFGVCSDCAGPIVSTIHSLPFDTLVVDIDGVMTDGTKMYNRQGKVFGKKYCDLDFTAIKRFKAAGIRVCFLSGDENVNKAMAETRKIDFFHNPPGTDKLDILPNIGDPRRIAYVGDDYYDIAIMKSVALSFCPNSSPAMVKSAVSAVIHANAGHGVLAKLYDMFEDQLPSAFPKDSPDVNPK